MILLSLLEARVKENANISNCRDFIKKEITIDTQKESILILSLLQNVPLNGFSKRFVGDTPEPLYCNAIRDLVITPFFVTLDRHFY